MPEYQKFKNTSFTNEQFFEVKYVIGEPCLISQNCKVTFKRSTTESIPHGTSFTFLKSSSFVFAF